MEEKTYDTIREYLENENGEDVLYIVSELHSYSGNLEDLVWHSMDDFDTMNAGDTPMETAQKIYFGDFNPNDSYFRYDGYGNFDSTSNPGYDSYDIDEIMDEIVNIPCQYLPSEIQEIIDECEEKEEEEDEE